jgi:hypothetical protein
MSNVMNYATTSGDLPQTHCGSKPVRTSRSPSEGSELTLLQGD